MSFKNMRFMKTGVFIILGIIFALIIGWGKGDVFKLSDTVSVFNPLNIFGSREGERSDGGHFRLIDEDGKVLDETSMKVYRGDEFIAGNNFHYQVTHVDGIDYYHPFPRSIEMGPK